MARDYLALTHSYILHALCERFPNSQKITVTRSFVVAVAEDLEGKTGATKVGPNNVQGFLNRYETNDFSEYVIDVNAIPMHPAFHAPSQSSTASNVQNLPVKFHRVESETLYPEAMEMDGCVYVPAKDPTYVAWGNSKTINEIVAARRFFPVFISGESGLGKSMMVEQECAALNREFVRVQINPLTDEDDLIGGLRLRNGSTNFEKGPVVRAMESGAILLLDEIDRGTNKLLCLQGVMEGKPIQIKKTGEIVFPRPGFNVVATGNTTGSGDDTGRYSAASVLDDAFLERFVVHMDQPVPGQGVETEILEKTGKKYGVVDYEFFQRILAWATTIRDRYNEGGVEHNISTRRLCHIINAYGVFQNANKAVAMCCNKFDPDTRKAFIAYWTAAEASTGDTTTSAATGTNGGFTPF